MATGGGRIERGCDFGRSEKGPKEPDFWKAADAGNKGLDRESQIRMKTAPHRRALRKDFRCRVLNHRFLIRRWHDPSII